MKVLVAYASKYGATEGIARRIGETLTKAGLEVVVARCKTVNEASGYDAFVVGSATYAFNWRKAAAVTVSPIAAPIAANPVMRARARMMSPRSRVALPISAPCPASGRRHLP